MGVRTSHYNATENNCMSVISRRKSFPVLYTDENIDRRILGQFLPIYKCFGFFCLSVSLFRFLISSTLTSVSETPGALEDLVDAEGAGLEEPPKEEGTVIEEVEVVGVYLHRTFWPHA